MDETDDTGQSTDGMERFTHDGLDCKMVKTDMGDWCGYVRRPEDVEPVRWTSDYDSKHDEIIDAEVDVWGGITYGPDEDGWVGFDDAHSSSLADHREFDTEKNAVKNETQHLADQIRTLQADSDKEGLRPMTDDTDHDNPEIETVMNDIRAAMMSGVSTDQTIDAQEALDATADVLADHLSDDDLDDTDDTDR